MPEELAPATGTEAGDFLPDQCRRQGFITRASRAVRIINQLGGRVEREELVTVSLDGFHGVHVPDPPPPLAHSQLSVGTVDIHQISQSLESTGYKEGAMGCRWDGEMERASREERSCCQLPVAIPPFPGKERSLALERRPSQDPAALQTPQQGASTQKKGEDLFCG